jgi:hypothetical protein
MSYRLDARFGAKAKTLLVVILNSFRIGGEKKLTLNNASDLRSQINTNFGRFAD